MAPIRLRHPKGVSTIDVDFSTFTVHDLQQRIFAATEIPPTRQTIKSGYPPVSLTIEPGLPIDSLGLKPGEQIIVGMLQEATLPTSTSAVSRSFPADTTVSTGILASALPSSTVPPPRSTTSGPDCVETSDGGVLVHRIVPDDNSCLFSAVALIFAQDISRAQQMRQIIAEGIQTDSDTYNEGILGMAPGKYISTILKPTTWGGAIELGILATHFNTEIASIDVETGRIDHFAPNPSSPIRSANRTGGNRCILIYSGIHYDAATLAPMADAPAEWHQTVFPIASLHDDTADPILVAAKQLADILRQKKAYTNTATFDLKCEQCGQGLKGEKEARAHAEQTGHVRFGEY